MITHRFPFSTSFSIAPQNSAVELRAGKHFRFDLDAVNTFCLGDLPARLVDFLRIASSLYVVDRLVKRRPTGGVRGSSRTIGLKVGVLDGGLDSAAGLVARMIQSPGRPVLPVIVWHQPRQRHLVREQLKTLGRRFDVAVDPLIVKVAMMWKSLLERDLEESTQRCRCFLFASLGAIAPIMHGQRLVEVFESGIGAINLPPMAGMVGAMTTKSAHPKFLRLMTRLASLVAEVDVEFRLPFFDRTKGEVVRKLAEAGLEELARLTASCVHYPLRHSRQKQCGICPACIFRRQAMTVAGIADSEDTYKYDFLGSPSGVSRIPSKRLLHLKAFLMQVASLKDVCAGKPLPRRVARHLVSTEVLADGHPREAVAALLARHRDEWMAIALDGNLRGLPWARLLTTPRPQRQGVTHASA
jgi:hypothetical protein